MPSADEIIIICAAALMVTLIIIVNLIAHRKRMQEIERLQKAAREAREIADRHRAAQPSKSAVELALMPSDKEKEKWYRGFAILRAAQTVIATINQPDGLDLLEKRLAEQVSSGEITLSDSSKKELHKIFKADKAKVGDASTPDYVKFMEVIDRTLLT